MINKKQPKKVLLKRGRIIDPFCGTGGILIEAADMKMEAVGIDVSARMVENSIGNLKNFY